MLYSRLNRPRACLVLRTLVLGLISATSLVICNAEDGHGKFKKAEVDSMRLPPSSFSLLPLAIQQELIRRGCTIPQVSGEKPQSNAIKGSFLKTGVIDFAVLCSANRTSTILVFPNSSATGVIELARRPDIAIPQGEDGNRIGFSREISPVGRDFILRHYHAHGGGKPPPIEHQGIDDAFVGKASVVHYWYRGRWFELTGTD